VQRLFALLAADRLVDADDELRRLRDLTETDEPNPLAAAMTLAQLWQRIVTNHFDDAAAMRHHLVEKLRPLGVEAGYGYALLHHPAAHTSTTPIDADADAHTWWRRATLLLSPAALVHRLPMLTATAELLAPTPRPLALQPTEQG
jgi:hypothetical protein